MLNSNKKNKLGFVQIDLLFAGFFFFLFLTLTINHIKQDFETSHNKNELLLLKSNAKDLCLNFKNELYVKSTNQLNTTKLNSYDYLTFKSEKKIEDFNFFMTIKNLDLDTTINSFGHNSDFANLFQKYSCHLSDNGQTLKITVEVWK